MYIQDYPRLSKYIQVVCATKDLATADVMRSSVQRAEYKGPSEAFLSLANEWFGIPVMQTSPTSMLFPTYCQANFCGGDCSDWWRLLCISDTCWNLFILIYVEGP